MSRSDAGSAPTMRNPALQFPLRLREPKSQQPSKDAAGPASLQPGSDAGGTAVPVTAARRRASACRAARELAGRIAIDGPVVGGVAEIRPGEGVVLEGGDVVRARTVISNADPVVTGRLLGTSADPGFAERVDGWRTTSAVVKVNCGLSRLPRWAASTANEAGLSLGACR